MILHACSVPLWILFVSLEPFAAELSHLVHLGETIACVCYLSFPAKGVKMFDPKRESKGLCFLGMLPTAKHCSATKITSPAHPNCGDQQADYTKLHRLLRVQPRHYICVQLTCGITTTRGPVLANDLSTSMPHHGSN